MHASIVPIYPISKIPATRAVVRFERRCKHCVLVLDILGLLLRYGTYEYRGTTALVPVLGLDTVGGGDYETA